MSIEVRCPNPDCGQVHRVKNHWAGKKGGCPTCGHPIVVPALPGQTPAPVPLATPVEPAARTHPVSAQKTAPAGAAELDRQSLGLSSPAGGKAAPSRPPQPKPQPAPEPEEVVDDGEIFEAGVVPEDDRNIQAWPEEEPTEHPIVAEPDEDYKKPVGTFSWGKAAVLLLGIFALGGVAAIPYLPGPSYKATLSSSKEVDMSPPKNERYQKLLNILFLVSASGAGLALLGFVISLARKRLGLAALLTAYPAVLASGGILVLCTMGVLAQMDEIEQMRKVLARDNTTLTGRPGLDLYTGVGCAGAATILLAVAILLIHRSLWARILFGSFAVLGLLGAAGFIYLAKTAGSSHSALSPPAAILLAERSANPPCHEWRV
jgi:hypothetical protein